jgi:hypothetical protein
MEPIEGAQWLMEALEEERKVQSTLPTSWSETPVSGRTEHR